MKRRFSFFVAVAVTCGLLAGCVFSETKETTGQTSAETVESTEAKKAPDSGVTLRFVDVNTSEERRTYFEDLFEAFEAEKGIRVTYEGVQWDYAADSLTEMGENGNLPDVLTVHDAWMGHFTQEGWLLPLTSFYEEQLEADMNRAARMSVGQQISLYGDIYRIPDGLTNAGIFYRKDWVKEIGYRIPVGQDWTWEAFFDLERALTDAKKERYGASFRGSRGGFDVVQNMLLTLTGGRTYDEEGNFLLMSDECIFMFEEFCSLYLDGHAPVDALNWGFTELVDHFADGQTGTLYNNTDVVPTLLEKMDKEQWGVLPVPTAKDGYVYNSTSYSYAYSVAADSEYQEEAMQLIAYMSNAENNLNYCKIAGMVPIRNDVEDDPMFGQEGPYSGFIRQLDLDNLAFGTSYGAFDYADMHQGMMHLEIQKYLVGEQSAKDVLFNIGTELERRMKQYLKEHPGTKVEEPVFP